MSAPAEPLPITAEPPVATAFRPRAVDRWLAWVGDRINPILVKEGRQALKSRQFVTTFSLVLFFAWGWTLVGAAMTGPEARYSGGGQEMFIGYYVILGLALLVVVPFGAFRSLLAEREEQTYESVAITTLRPSQIVGGKLCSAGLQMLIYFSALAPCLAFTYLLRGIDLFTILFSLLVMVLVSAALSLGGLLLATLATEKHWQTLLTVLLILGLLYAAGLVLGLVVESAVERVDRSFATREFWQGFAAVCLIGLGMGLLVFYAAAARLTFVSENRSTRLRLLMLLEHAILVGVFSWFWLKRTASMSGFLIFALVCLCLYWYGLGVLMTAESGQLSLRVRRRLPQSTLGRAVLGWLQPGPGTGYVFTLASLLGAILVLAVAVRAEPPVTVGVGFYFARPAAVIPFAILAVSYVAIYLGLGLLVLRLLRRFVGAPLMLALLVQLLLMLLLTFVPLLVQAFSLTLRQADYSPWQYFNPFWTLSYVAFHFDWFPPFTEVLWVVPGAAAVVFCGNLPWIIGELRQGRVEVPARVAEEDAALAALRRACRPGPHQPLGRLTPGRPLTVGAMATLAWPCLPLREFFGMPTQAWAWHPTYRNTSAVDLRRRDAQPRTTLVDVAQHVGHRRLPGNLLRGTLQEHVVDPLDVDGRKAGGAQAHGKRVLVDDRRGLGLEPREGFRGQREGGTVRGDFPAFPAEPSPQVALISASRIGRLGMKRLARVIGEEPFRTVRRDQGSQHATARPGSSRLHKRIHAWERWPKSVTSRG